MKKNHLLFYLWLSVAVIIITMVWLARTALIPFFIGGILAYILKPLVNQTANLVQKSGIASPQLKKMIAIIFVYGFLGIMTLMTLLIIGDVLIDLAIFLLYSTIPLVAEQIIKYPFKVVM